MRRPATLESLIAVAVAAALAAGAAAAAEQAAIVSKPSVDVHSGPDFKSGKVATLKKNAAVKVAGQQGLWYRVSAEGGSGFLRVNDVRMAYAGKEPSDADMQALFTGNAGRGRVSETASVRGLDESDLRAASPDTGELSRMEGARVTAQAAAADARGKDLQATRVPYAVEDRRPVGGQVAQSEKRSQLSAARGLLARAGIDTGGRADSALRVADAATGKSEPEMLAQETALGPEIAARVLGAAPLWQDAAAQKRVNTIGRWMASQTARPDLPWTFGVIDDGEINAFAAPGGYVIVTRGLYRLLADDAEVAAVLGHEIAHVIQRDHFEVIRKQQATRATTDVAMSQLRAGNFAEQMAKDYVREHGAAILTTSLDRGAEFRADEGAAVYLARAGYNPLALYAVLQKMTALGDRSSKLGQLYRTHPPFDARLQRLDGGLEGLDDYVTR